MAAVLGAGATFSFSCTRGTLSGGLTRITVETPSAEIVDVTGYLDSTDATVLVPTGAWKGGSISAEVIVGVGVNLQSLVRGVGTLTFSTTGYSVSRRVIFESASESVAAGDIVRASLKFVMTDYTGS